MQNIKKEIKVYFTEHFANYTVTQIFAKSNDLIFEPLTNYTDSENFIFCSYGIKRGVDQIIKNSKDFIYIDHGYFGGSNRVFLEDGRTRLNNFDGFFRFIKNDLYFNMNNLDADPSRFNTHGINLKELNKKGEYILLSEPSKYTMDFLNIPNWTTETIKLIKKYTDRSVLVHNKFSKIKLDEALKKAYAFVSCQSTAAFKAIAMGVPAYFTHPTMTNFGKISEINNRILNHQFLYIASNNQWKLNELYSDEFKSFLSKI